MQLSIRQSIFVGCADMMRKRLESHGIGKADSQASKGGA